METFREYFKNKFMAQKDPRQHAGGQRVKNPF